MPKQPYQILLLLGSICILVLIGIGTYAVFFGTAYRERLSTVQPGKIQENRGAKQKIIKKITIKDEGCTEITADGVVRQYEQCDRALSQVDRLSNLRDISELFHTVLEKDLETYAVKPNGAYIELIVETDEGVERYYVPQGSQNNSFVGQLILNIVERIIADIPAEIVSPTSGPTAVPSSTSAPSAPTPTPTSYMAPTPTPTSQGSANEPFTCDFHDTKSTKKSVAVSDVVCSTAPTSP